MDVGRMQLSKLWLGGLTQHMPSALANFRLAQEVEADW